jgi:hypothetical protein
MAYDYALRRITTLLNQGPEAAVEIGEILHATKEDGGAVYYRWLCKELNFDRATYDRYIKAWKEGGKTRSGNLMTRAATSFHPVRIRRRERGGR